MNHPTYDPALENLTQVVHHAQDCATGMFDSLGLQLDPRVYVYAIPDVATAGRNYTRAQPEVPPLHLNMLTIRAEALKHAAANPDPFGFGSKSTSANMQALIAEEVQGRAARAAVQGALNAMPDAKI